MAVVLEFYLDIIPAKLVKGQGLCKLTAEARDQVNEDLGWENEMELCCLKWRTYPQDNIPGIKI